MWRVLILCFVSGIKSNSCENPSSSSGFLNLKIISTNTTVMSSWPPEWWKGFPLWSQEECFQYSSRLYSFAGSSCKLEERTCGRCLMTGILTIINNVYRRKKIMPMICCRLTLWLWCRAWRRRSSTTCPARWWRWRSPRRKSQRWIPRCLRELQGNPSTHSGCLFRRWSTRKMFFYDMCSLYSWFHPILNLKDGDRGGENSVDGEKDVWRSHRENAIRVILVIFILQVICHSSFQLE